MNHKHQPKQAHPSLESTTLSIWGLVSCELVPPSPKPPAPPLPSQGVLFSPSFSGEHTTLPPFPTFVPQKLTQIPRSPSSIVLLLDLPRTDLSHPSFPLSLLSQKKTMASRNRGRKSVKKGVGLTIMVCGAVSPCFHCIRGEKEEERS